MNSSLKDFGIVNLSLVVLAVVVGFVGQFILFLSHKVGLPLGFDVLANSFFANEILGFILMIIAGIMFVFAIKPSIEIENIVEDPEYTDLIDTNKRNFAFLIAGATFYILAFLLNFSNEVLAFALVIVAIILLAIYLFLIDKKLNMSLKFPIIDTVIVIVFLISTFLLYYYNVDFIPGKFDGPEANFGLHVQDFIANGQVNKIFASNVLIVYIQKHLFESFGYTIFAIRIQSVIFALLSIVAFYFFIRQLFSRETAVVATVIFSFSHLFIELARLGVPYASSIFVFVSSLLFLTLGLKKNSYLFFLLAGIFSTLGFFLHENAKIVLFILVIYLITLWIKNEDARSRLLRQIGVFFIGVIMMLLPMVVKHADTFFTQTPIASVFAQNEYNHMKGVYNTTNPIVVLVKSTVYSLKSFNSGSDNSSLYGNNKSLLDFVTGVFFVLGLFLTFYFIKDDKFRLFVISFILIILFGAVLVVDPPRYPNLSLIIPVFSAIAAIGMVKTANVLKEYWGETLITKGVSIFILVVLSISIAALNYSIYFDYYIKRNISESNYHVPTLVGSQIGTLGEFYDIYLINFANDKDKFNVDYDTVKFLTQGKKINIINDAASQLPLKEKTNLDVSFMFFQYNFDKALPLLKRIYPFGKDEIIYNPDNIPVLGIYKVSAKEINSKK